MQSKKRLLITLELYHVDDIVNSHIELFLFVFGSTV